MKKFLSILSALLILTVFSTEAKAEVKQDNTEVVFEYRFEAIPTAVDNVVVVIGSVEYLTASVVNYTEVGGSDIISGDGDDPDDCLVDNPNVNDLYTDNAIVTKIYHLNRQTFGGQRVKLIKQNIKIANNVNDKVGNITANVGKLA